MAINGRVRVGFGEAFPQGLYVWEHTKVEPARDFERSTREKPVQATDRDSGLPLWQLDALDPDEMARGKQNAVTIRIVAQHCPVLPDTTVGPVRPIELENLSISGYVEQPTNGRPRVAWSYRATGVTGPDKPSAAASSGKSAAAGQGNKEPGKEPAA